MLGSPFFVLSQSPSGFWIKRRCQTSLSISYNSGQGQQLHLQLQILFSLASGRIPALLRPEHVDHPFLRADGLPASVPSTSWSVSLAPVSALLGVHAPAAGPLMEMWGQPGWQAMRFLDWKHIHNATLGKCGEMAKLLVIGYQCVKGYERWNSQWQVQGGLQGFQKLAARPT